LQLILVFFLHSFLSANSCNLGLASYLGFGQGASDITGFYQDGREFAVVGLVEDDAAVFVDITDPFNPFEISRITGTPSIWRDLKYWDRHVYIGTEAPDGVKVVSVDNPDEPTLVYTIDDFTNSHNIHIDMDGYLYVVGAADHDIWIYDLSIPYEPILVGTWNGEYLHDIEVYNNKLYGAGIYSGQFYIIDVNDKANPETILSHFTGLEGVSTHDCAITYDEKYLITADETSGGHVKIWDITDYQNINMVSEYMTNPNHSVHNIYIRPDTDLLIISYYVDGTRVVDISDPTEPLEVGYFDTSDLTGLFDGNWGTYAYLPSGYIISSDRQNGLFIFESPLTNDDMEWSICYDCAGIPNGPSYLDNCNVCDQNISNDCAKDCAGIWGGDSYLDDCGICDNETANDNITCFQDCAGIWGGNLLFDECGVCDGPGAVFECGCCSLLDENCDCDELIELLEIDRNYFEKYVNLIKIYPNPFNSFTNIEFNAMDNTKLKIEILDLRGRKVDIINDDYVKPGKYNYLWDASLYPSSTYFIKIDNNNSITYHKLILLK